MRKRAVILLALLSGCAARRYSDPTGDQREYSRITIKNVSALPLTARLYDDAIACSGPVNLFETSRAMSLGETKAIYARKGAPLTIGAWYLFNWGTGYTRCDLNTTFVPTAASYGVVYESDGIAKKCRVAATEGDGGSSRAVPPDRLFVRRFHVPFLQDGPWCEALTEAQASAIPAGRPPANP